MFYGFIFAIRLLVVESLLSRKKSQGKVIIFRLSQLNSEYDICYFNYYRFHKNKKSSEFIQLTELL